MNLFLRASFLFILSISLIGCENPLSTVRKETTEAVENLKNDAQNVKESVDNKVEDVNTAVQSVKDAAQSVDNAIQDVKNVTQ